METIIDFACSHAHSAHWFFFILLLLGGFSLPISEDLVLLAGGAIASTCIPDETLYLYFWLYMGCWMSAWIAYSIGRYLGPKIYDIHWFRHVVTPKRIAKVNHYYEKYGVLVFMAGRFIPGGLRNAMFMSAGLGKMHFGKFILRDGYACLLSTSLIFSIGHAFGRNYQTVLHYFKTYDEIVIVIIFIIVLAFSIKFWWMRSNIKAK